MTRLLFIDGLKRHARAHVRACVFAALLHWVGSCRTRALVYIPNVHRSGCTTPALGDTRNAECWLFVGKSTQFSTAGTWEKQSSIEKNIRILEDFQSRTLIGFLCRVIATSALLSIPSTRDRQFSKRMLMILLLVSENIASRLKTNVSFRVHGDENYVLP